jgi:hypothetical protein
LPAIITAQVLLNATSTRLIWNTVAGASDYELRYQKIDEPNGSTYSALQAVMLLVIQLQDLFLHLQTNKTHWIDLYRL